MAVTGKELPACPVETTLTELGCSLKPVLEAMGAWGREYKAKQV